MLIDTHKIFHPIKNWVLRSIRGYGCCDLWNLDYYLATIILPGLRGLGRSKECFMGYPVGLKSLEEWKTEINKMIWALEHIVKENDGDCCFKASAKGVKNHSKLEQEGLELFGKRFRNLWS